MCTRKKILLILGPILNFDPGHTLTGSCRVWINRRCLSSGYVWIVAGNYILVGHLDMEQGRLVTRLHEE